MTTSYLEVWIDDVQFVAASPGGSYDVELSMVYRVYSSKGVQHDLKYTVPVTQSRTPSLTYCVTSRIVVPKSLDYSIISSNQASILTTVSYTTVGTLTVDLGASRRVQYLVVGGGGGSDDSTKKGGEGGEVRQGLINISGEQTIVVGPGGGYDIDGSNSQFGSIIASGGTKDGGGTYPSGKGNDGTYAPLTAATYGGDGGGGQGGLGGLGGGGTGGSGTSPGQSGTPNTGGGRGGNGASIWGGGGLGGSGIVVLQYPALTQLTYVVVPTTWIGKVLQYRVLTSHVIPKSLKYTVPHACTIALGLTYEVVARRVDLPCTLKYVVYSTKSISKSLQYVVYKLKVQRQLTYKVYAAHLNTKQMSYVVPQVYLTSTLSGGSIPTNISFAATVNFNIIATPATYSWDFGDNTYNTITGTNTFHQYTSNGVFAATVYMYIAGMLAASDSVTITIQDVTLPVCDFWSDVTTGTFPLTVTFQNLSAAPGGGSLTYDWDFGDGTAHSTVRDPVHTYTAATSYTVTLIVTGSGGSTTKTKVNYITGVPVPLHADFTVSYGGYIVSVPGARTYVVTLTVTDKYGSVDSISKYVTVLVTGFVAFTDLSTGEIVQWLWDYGDRIW
jgi:PKD repeat protein